MKVCILSDSHDHIPLIDAAVAQAKAAGAEAVLHCGDVVAPSTLHCLEQHGLPVHVIHGNNVGDLVHPGPNGRQAGQLHPLPRHGRGLNLGGQRIFLVHYPHYARAMAATGDWDLVCCGHSHAPARELLPNLQRGQYPAAQPRHHRRRRAGPGHLHPRGSGYHDVRVPRSRQGPGARAEDPGACLGRDTASGFGLLFRVFRFTRRFSVFGFSFFVTA